MQGRRSAVYIPVMQPSREMAWPVYAAKWAARGLLHVPVRLRMAVDRDFPWLVADSVRWLLGFLRPNMTGFEWGSGRSTLFFARHSARLVSVEHKAKWFRRVSANLAERGLHNAECLFRPPDPQARPSPMRPAILAELGFRPKPELAAYADAILDYPPDCFDYVCVDGRARIECAVNALDRLKPCGALILDNSERAKYRPVFAVLAAWPRHSFANGVWETTIFRKPDRCWKSP